jgi:polyisoprenoid-binding protein YceI
LNSRLNTSIIHSRYFIDKISRSLLVRYQVSLGNTIAKERSRSVRKFVQVSIVSILLLASLVACGGADPAPVETLEGQEELAEAQDDAVEEPEVESPAEEVIPAEGLLTFQIVSEGTEARFIIDEVLRGEPTTVVGVTDQVSGEIRIDLANPVGTELGVISIESGSLRTDNNFRNGAIEQFILQSGTYPEILFTPTAIEGLPTDVAVGDTFSFNVVGDLTIREITQSVTFDVEVSAESDARIQGSARSVVLRDAYELTIPSVPQVADVSNEVFLELDFVATR